MPFILMLFIEATFIIGGGEKSILECLVNPNPNVKFYLFNLPRCCNHEISLNCCGIAVNKYIIHLGSSKSYWFLFINYQCFVLLIDRRSLRIANALVYQTFISSLLLTIIMVILEYAEVLERDVRKYLFHYDNWNLKKKSLWYI